MYYFFLCYLKLIDIYAYYIVGLYNDYNFRSNFSKLKVEYINDNISPEIKTIYGFASSRKTVPTGLSYISLSLKYNPSEDTLHLRETTQDYYKIIFDYVIAEHVCEITKEKKVKLKNEDNCSNETIKEVFADYSNMLKKGNKKEFRYLAVYAPPFEGNCLFNDILKQERLNEKITVLLAQKRPNCIQVNNYGSNSFYFLMTEKFDDDIFPLFPYFDWYMIEAYSGDSEEV